MKRMRYSKVKTMMKNASSGLNHLYSGTSPIRKRLALGPYGRPIPRAL